MMKNMSINACHVMKDMYLMQRYDIWGLRLLLTHSWSVWLILQTVTQRSLEKSKNKRRIIIKVPQYFSLQQSTNVYIFIPPMTCTICGSYNHIRFLYLDAFLCFLLSLEKMHVFLSPFNKHYISFYWQLFPIL